MPSKGPKAPRVPKKKHCKHPCERGCPHFVEVEKAKGETYFSVLCKCSGKVLVRSAPAKSGFISCPDHPEYKQRNFNQNWITP